MQTFEVVVNLIVIVGIFYLTVVMALVGWIAGLRRGQAVMLLPERGEHTWSIWAHLGLVLISLVISALLFYILWIPLPVTILPTTSVILKICGLILFLAGLFLTVWARRTLGSMWGISTSRQVKLLPDHHLVQRGPYRRVRHPMYFGWWIALVGLILIYPTWVLVGLLVISVAIFYRRARLEEAVLAAKFGKEWQAYVAHTKFLMPFVY